MSLDLKETPQSAAPLTEVLVEQKKRQKKIERNPFDNDCVTFTAENRERMKSAISFLKNNRVVIVYDDTRASREIDKIDVYLECISSRKIRDVIARLSDLRGISNLKHSRIPIIRGSQLESVPWFPRCIGDLDESNENVIMCGTELEADHPGFKDQEYRKRRDFFTQIAMNYKCGDEIQTVEYTEEETRTWSRVYNELTRLYPTHACQEQITNLKILAENCPGFDGKQVPQLSNVSKFLQNRTGFRMRPVAGFLTPRDFLAGLAFKVFNCTQYMRHSGDPFYTPEPDVCHELLGHVPLLADPSFAQFSQELGLASLGASDSDIKKLASCYLYTVEFGLCKENGQERAYGAGLLSCVDELKHALTSPEKMEEFIPEITAETDSFVTCFQPKYFVSETIDEVKFKMREFASSIRRPFDLEYDDATNTVRIKAPTATKKDFEIFNTISREYCNVTRTTVA